ncbi:MAG: hypothetical protein HOF11_05520 [Rhodospirillaceae bacterium]|jgi:hypothetical protein|nr:hypothetical protein [Rhodospirillaceae bacterium]
MSEPLQPLNYRDSPYIRPGQKWICGHASEGCPCKIGPDDSGHCRGGFECEPMRDGDRWNCTRSPLSGGPCPDGPLADGTCCRQIPLCRPVRSWRARRGAVVRWVLAVVTGLVILVLASDYRTAFIDPGDLSFQHSALADCGSCHVAFHEGITGWLRAAWSDNNALEDSKPCIACHRMADSGLLPHSLPSEALHGLSANVSPATVTGRSVGVQLANLAFGRPEKNDEAVPCMTCHSEHQGAESNLTHLSDDHCNTCHQQQFHSLDSGHPDFASYPYERRTPIKFDHTSHIDKYFRDAKMVDLAPGKCRDCHKTDVNDRLMEVRSFEESCGACHAEEVAGAGRASAKGMAIFAVPGLDVAALRDQGVAIGTWPEFADGDVPPVMNLLLSADPGYRAAYAVFNAIDDPMDLTDATGEQLAAVGTVAWSVKSLLFDLRSKGVAALHARLKSILGRPLSAVEKASLTALLPLDTIVAAQKNWFPALTIEVHRWRNGMAVPIPGDKMEHVTSDEKKLEAGMSGEEDTGSDNDGDKEIDTGKDNEIDTDDDDGDDEIATGKDDDDDDEIATGKDDNDDDGDIDTGKDDEIDTDDKDDDDEIATGKDDDDEEIDTDDDDDDGKSPGGAGKKMLPVTKMASAEDWNMSGGWYRDEYVLRYRPTGHGDGFFRAWLDLTGKSAQSLVEASQVFESLISKKAPGLCGGCHSVDKQADGNLIVNWRGYQPEDGLKKSVRFSHAAHFSMLDERGCLTCHARDSKADFASGYKDRNPGTFAANFKPLPRAVCAECHTVSKAGDSCLTCHNYHLGVFHPVATHTKGMFKEVLDKR